jgi:hypothetical protein
VRTAGGAGAETGGAVATGPAGFCDAAGAITRGGALAAGALGAGGFAAGAAGFASCAGGDTGRCGGALGAVAVPCCLARIAFKTSPGLEMCDRSIFGFKPSASGRAARLDFALWPLPEPCKTARTLSASKSSSELECVFFSVTPTSVNTSRMALLLTSSSLARSLIRILLIRLFVPPDCPAKPSYQPHGLLSST